MEVQFAVAKVGKYATSESGDTLEMIERPHGGLSFILADGQRSGKSAKAISNVVARKAMQLLSEGVRDGAAARAAHDYLYTYRGGKVSATLNILSIDADSKTFVVSRNNDAPVIVHTAEAGLFQTSYNARTTSPLMPQLFERYSANPSGFREIFEEDVRCSDADLENFGGGKGREFQRLSKACPAFAAEFTAVGLRNRRKHWGPINRKAAEIRPECDAMLVQVQNVVDKFNLCLVLQ